MTQSLAKILALPFVLYSILFFAGGLHELSDTYVLLFIGSVILLALLYVFQYQINGWWWRRNPPALSRKLASWLAHHSTYMQGLSPIDKEKFSRRISLFIKLKTFHLKVEKDYELEEDTKALIAHEFQRLAMNSEAFIYEDFDQFVVYNHPFPSPQIEALHSVELHDEDGVVILSREQLLNGFFDSNQFNIGLWAAIMAFVRINPRLDYPTVMDWDLDLIAEELNIELEPIKVHVGTDSIRKLNLLIYAYMVFPTRLADWNPNVYRKLSFIFGSVKPS